MPEPLLFESPEAAQEWVRSVFDAVWLASLTPAQCEALQALKSGAYSAVNGFLRTGRSGSLPSKRTIVGLISDAKEALKVKPLPAAIVVFRGIRFSTLFGADVLPEQLVGGVFQNPGFMRTTLWLPVARRFGPDLLQITVPEGEPAVWLDIFEQRHELEILLQPGTVLRVDGSEFLSNSRVLYTTCTRV